MKPEAKLKYKIMAFLKTLEPDLFAWRVEMRPGIKAGCSDIIAVYRGKTIAVEVKTPGNRPTALQTRFLNRITLAGGLSAVVTSVEEVKNVVDLLKKA